ncbi:Holliday junction resolvase RecU [Salibacterium aidingense]|uniref:Holliday junction resolvase RecU n=1 Tax=Salibacterium aidingense TaxID=384933 RepID=UPI000401064A|nr:Holliday junction resolvase RecU [Salibacterium aidingense]
MKQTQANRGIAFENLVNIANTQYKNKGLALISKRPTPVKVLKSKGTQVLKGFYEQKSSVDYSGIYAGIPIEFEAKSISGKRFELKNIHDHQLQHLKNAEQHGATVFLLIEFRDTREIFFTPLSLITLAVKNAARGGRKSIPIDDFQIYADQVNQGRGVPLDYLAVVDKHVEKVTS